MKDSTQNIYKIFLTIASIIIILAGIKAASSIVILFLLSIFISTVTYPILYRLQSLGINKFISYFIVLSLVIFIFAVFSYILSSSVDSFLNNKEAYQNKIDILISKVAKYLQTFNISIDKNNILEFLNPAYFFNYITIFLKTLTSLISKSFIVFLGSTFMLLEINRFKYKLNSISQKGEMLYFFENFAHKINKYLVIKTIISLLTGFFITIGLYLLNVDFAPLWGLLAFLLNFIPSFGSILAAIPALLLSLINNGFEIFLLVLILYLIVNIILGNILDPKLMGENLGLSVVTVFFSLIFWGYILGPMGMFLAVPISMSIKLALQSHPSTKDIAKFLAD